MPSSPHPCVDWAVDLPSPPAADPPSPPAADPPSDTAPSGIKPGMGWVLSLLAGAAYRASAATPPVCCTASPSSSCACMSSRTCPRSSCACMSSRTCPRSSCGSERDAVSASARPALRELGSDNASAAAPVAAAPGDGACVPPPAVHATPPPRWRMLPVVCKAVFDDTPVKWPACGGAAGGAGTGYPCAVSHSSIARAAYSAPERSPGRSASLAAAYATPKAVRSGRARARVARIACVAVAPARSVWGGGSSPSDSPGSGTCTSHTSRHASVQCSACA